MVLAAGSASGHDFPDKGRPFKILVPSGVGSTGDLLARVYARGITEVSGLTVVVENKPGAEGIIGVQVAKSAPPDGYTIMLTSNSTQVLNVIMMRDIPYDPVADFVPLTGAGSVALGMWVNAKQPFRSASDFFAAARSSPGKYSAGNSTTVGRLGTEMLEQMASISLLPVLFKTMPEVMTAVSAGQVDMAFGTLSSAEPFLKSGRLRPLAVTGRTRLSALPDVPTMHEAGLSDYEITSWLATYAPAKTPPEIVAKLRDILRSAAKSSYVTGFLNTFAMQPLNISGDELTTLQQSELKKLRQVTSVANKKGDY